MRFSIIIYDVIYEVGRALRTHRLMIALYASLFTIGIAIGIGFGISVTEKLEYLDNNGLPLFRLLRCDFSVFAYFFCVLGILIAFSAVCSSLWQKKYLCIITFVAITFYAYLTSLSLTIVIAVYGASALLFALICYIPLALVEYALLCALSFRCYHAAVEFERFGFCKSDIRDYYIHSIPAFILIFIAEIIRLILTAITATGLIGAFL